MVGTGVSVTAGLGGTGVRVAIGVVEGVAVADADGVGVRVAVCTADGADGPRLTTAGGGFGVRVAVAVRVGKARGVGLSTTVELVGVFDGKGASSRPRVDLGAPPTEPPDAWLVAQAVRANNIAIAGNERASLTFLLLAGPL
jgi:hypothetical protein